MNLGLIFYILSLTLTYIGVLYMAVKVGQILKIGEDFEEWTLDDPIESHREFFSFIMSQLDERDFATLNLRVPMDDGIGGFYTDHLYLDKICLPDIVTVDEDNKVLKFNPSYETDEDGKPTKHLISTADENFGIFVHESCHFLHFGRDEGVFESPLMKGKQYSMEEMAHSPNLRRECEFEAGYRSMKFDKMYHLFPNKRIILDLNLNNMITYDKKYQSDEWKNKYKELVRPFFGDAKDKDGNIIIGEDGRPIRGRLKAPAKLKKFNQGLIHKVEKFCEWQDKNHEIKGVL